MRLSSSRLDMGVCQRSSFGNAAHLEHMALTLRACGCKGSSL